MELIVVVETSRSSHSPSSSGLGWVRLLLTSFLSFSFPFLLFFSFLFFIYFSLFVFSSVFFPFTISFFSSSSSSFAPSSSSSSSSFNSSFYFSSRFTSSSTFHSFPPWVGENNAKRIIFYGHNKCRFKPLK